MVTFSNRRKSDRPGDRSPITSHSPEKYWDTSRNEWRCAICRHKVTDKRTHPQPAKEAR